MKLDIKLIVFIILIIVSVIWCYRLEAVLNKIDCFCDYEYYQEVANSMGEGWYHLLSWSLIVLSIVLSIFYLIEIIIKRTIKALINLLKIPFVLFLGLIVNGFFGTFIVLLNCID